MGHQLPRRTVYAATAIALLALAGGWTLAAGTTQTVGPAQNSSITVTAPNGFTTATVQSTQLLTVSGALITGLTGTAGTQAAGPGNGLNSTTMDNAPLASCGGAFCEANYSAVDTATPLSVGDSALQLMLTVTQPASGAVGFDVQVEVIFSTTGPSVYTFGTGYFDSNTAGGGTAAFFAVGLYIDLGVAATLMPSVSDVVVTMNSCITAQTCP
jgi:hypothetical protein